MSQPNDSAYDPTGNQHPDREHTLSQPGYETTDVNVTGIVVFLVGLGAFVLVFFVLCFGMGKLINEALVKRDGPASVWKQQVVLGGARENMANNPEMEQKELRTMTSRFPTPRLQNDDGHQDLADLHARESLLLDHYSWANDQHTKVRIPIERAMQLIAQKGLPVQQGPVPVTENGTQALWAGVESPEVTVPLTDGFAPTATDILRNELREQQLQQGNGGPATHAQLELKKQQETR